MQNDLISDNGFTFYFLFTAVEKNLVMWTEMKNFTAAGIISCVRAKVNMQSDNGCLRDPTIYRCKSEPHIKTGEKYKYVLQRPNFLFSLFR